MNERVRSVLQANQQFTQAKDEQEIVKVVLQLALELTGAVGASFVPLDDLGHPGAAVRKGHVPEPVSDAWLEYLALPSSRQKCAHCGKMGHATQTCHLLGSSNLEVSGIYCLPIRYSNYDLGVLNIFAPAPGLKQPDTPELLKSMIDSSSLAIANERLRRRELAMFDQFRSAREKIEHNPLEDVSGQLACLEDQLSVFEYKAQMDERTRLAREIHDGLAQTLAFIKLQVSQLQGAIERNDPSRSKRIADALYVSIAEAYRDAREAINMLRVVPGEPGEAQFENWLRQTVEEFDENTDLVVHLDVDLQTTFPEEIHFQLIRIVQEAMVNVRKHARASQIWVSCSELAESFVVEVRDDGEGFFFDDVTDASQHGIKGMKERAVLIGADLDFESQPGKGTLVRLLLPRQAEWSETSR